MKTHTITKTKTNFSLLVAKSFPIVRGQERWGNSNKGLLTLGAKKKKLVNFVQNNRFGLFILWWWEENELALELFNLHLYLYNILLLTVFQNNLRYIKLSNRRLPFSKPLVHTFVNGDIIGQCVLNPFRVKIIIYNA